MTIMIELLAFALVAVALGAPCLLNLIWGRIEVEQPPGARAA
jgi:hypothetical protein